MPGKQSKLIITTLGIDGAASAAVLLHAYPHAAVEITSKRRIGQTLHAIVERPERPGAVLIGGVGMADDFDDVLHALRHLKSKRIPVTWFCGRGYLDAFAPKLAQVCNPVFLDAWSNTAAIVEHLNLNCEPPLELALTLAREYVKKTKRIAKRNQLWHDYFGCAAAKYFKFGETASFVRAIQKLSVLADFTNEEQADIDTFRQGKNYIPLGKSKRMKDLRALIHRIAPIDEPVLILGPTGAGKEIAARLLHESSGLGGPFIPVNCAILSTNTDLAHTRLFGHEAGAYTGAKERREGAFVLAEGGTLFLDEVAELPIDVQTQLLRVLEENTITPLGTMKPQHVHTRLVAATNQDLPAAVNKGSFRADLYHRLNVLTLHIPPLAEHREDIRDIAESLLYELDSAGHEVKLSRADWHAIHNYAWPGNVRQLRNVLKRAAYMQLPVRQVIEEEEDATAHQPAASTVYNDLHLFRPTEPEEVLPEEEIRKAYIRHVYELFNGNITQTAEALHIAKNTLKKWLLGD